MDEQTKSELVKILHQYGIYNDYQLIVAISEMKPLDITQFRKRIDRKEE